MRFLFLLAALVCTGCVKTDGDWALEQAKYAEAEQTKHIEAREIMARVKKRDEEATKAAEPVKDEMGALKADFEEVKKDLLKKLNEAPALLPVVKAIPKPEPPKKEEKKDEEASWQKVEERLAKGIADLKQLFLEAKTNAPQNPPKTVYEAAHIAERLKAEFVRELAKLHDRFIKDDRRDYQLYGRSDSGRIYRNIQRNLLYNEWVQYYQMRYATEVAGGYAYLVEPASPSSILVPLNVSSMVSGVWVNPSWAPKKK